MNASTIESLKARVAALGHVLVDRPSIDGETDEFTDPGLYVVDTAAGRFAVTPTGHGRSDDVAEIQAWCEKREPLTTAQSVQNYVSGETLQQRLERVQKLADRRGFTIWVTVNSEPFRYRITSTSGMTLEGLEEVVEALR